MRNRGVALVSVLWVLAVLSVVGLSFSLTVRVDTDLSANAMWEAQALELARTGLEYTFEQIADEKAQGKTYCSLSDSWFAYTSDDLGLELEDGVFSIRVADEAGKLDINTASQEQLITLFQDEELAASLIDWRDADDESLDGGSETAVYDQGSPSYTPRNDRFRSIGELALVSGITADQLWGAQERRYSERTVGEVRGWCDLLAIAAIDSNLAPDGQAKTNLNTASEDDLRTALEALIDEGKIQAILDYRERMEGTNTPSAGDALNPGGGIEIPDDLLDGVRARQADLGEGLDETDLGTTTGLLTGGVGIEGGGASEAADTSLAFPTTGALINIPELDITDMSTIWDYVTAVDADVVEGRVNINTAPADVIAAILRPEVDEQIAQGIADALVSYRASGLPYTAVPEVLDADPDIADYFDRIADRLTVRSFIFTIESTGLAGNGRVERRVRQLVDLSGSQPNVLEQCVY